MRNTLLFIKEVVVFLFMFPPTFIMFFPIILKNYFENKGVTITEEEMSVIYQDYKLVLIALHLLTFYFYFWLCLQIFS